MTAVPEETLKLDGLDDIVKKLKVLDDKVSNRIARRGISAIARVIRREMRARAPRKTGNLRKHIRFRTGRFRNRKGYFAIIGVQGKTIRKRDKESGKLKELNNQDYPFYAGWLEYGTAAHRIPKKTVGRGQFKRRNKEVISFQSQGGGGVFSKVNNPGIKAQPYLRPAFEASKRRAAKEGVRTMQVEVEKACKGL